LVVALQVVAPGAEKKGPEMNDVAAALGTAIAGCLLWWPISFLAVKGSLGLTYQWKPFVLGWLLSVFCLSILYIIFAPQSFDKDPAAGFFAVMIPIAPCVFSAFILRRRFVSAALTPPKKANASTSLRTVVSRCWISIKQMPEAWLGGITLLGLLLASIFPNWVFEFRGYRLALGHGSIFNPPTYGNSDAYVHIDYALLAARCLGIAALGGITILIAYVYRRQRSIQSALPNSLLERTLGAAGKLIVTGYRGLSAQHGWAPTTATTDQQIIEIYRKVGTAFKEVARQRGEELKAGWLNTVVLKFFQVNEKMGGDFMEEHLSYELDKYRQEGLRSEYKKDLQLC